MVADAYLTMVEVSQCGEDAIAHSIPTGAVEICRPARNVLLQVGAVHGAMWALKPIQENAYLTMAEVYQCMEAVIQVTIKAHALRLHVQLTVPLAMKVENVLSV
mmetsp:Transcript_78900/g.92216  ORF Transcript_78900/g.92216 Transcript_78900/m.92216 type:complete len:104 (+) Transcript_78900:504-815(+)